MESKNLVHTIVFFLLLCVLATCDIDTDKEKCENDLVGLATCLPYVSGESRSPPTDCCTGLKTVLQKSPECICLLVKDRNDPSLGLKINATLALGLPSRCHAPANISACPSLLHLAPNSAEAKVFEDFEDRAKKDNATAITGTTAGSSSGKATATTGDNKSEGGGKVKRWLGIEMVVALVVTEVLVHSLLFDH